MHDPDSSVSRRTLLAGAAGAALSTLASEAAHAEYEGGDVITAATFIHGIPGRAEDLKAHLLSLSAATRAEAGCVAYDLYQSPETPSEFLRIERWKSSDQLEAHKRMPHLRASFEKRQREGWTTQITVWKRVAEDR
ncbi:MAG TPA: putative quinol monooxygenase [Myxococcota bacterium]|nr:putative quinol monooxygenase [Myxococcota bacterium]